MLREGKLTYDVIPRDVYQFALPSEIGPNAGDL
jgi:hypothetical protein